MATFGLEFTGKVPFETVYFHGLVRDEKNRKMSKSLGNVLDPLDIIPKYGTDALRMALVVGSAPGQDLAVGESKIKGYRNFSNKIWNASRFVLLQVSNGDLRTGEIGAARLDSLDINKATLTNQDKAILKDLENVKKSVTEKLDKFRFSQAGEELYEFFWHTFCDIYIEKAKEQIADEKFKDNTKKILIKILSESLILLHPFVPFVTEAVWQELRKVYPDLSKSIMISRWPL
jgi:valyl-tRNA synthetase